MPAETRREPLVSRAGARLSGSAAYDKQAYGEDENDELERDGDGVLEAALETGIADGDTHEEGEQPSDQQEHAKPGWDEAARRSRSAQEQQGNAEQDPEVALETPL